MKGQRRGIQIYGIEKTIWYIEDYPAIKKNEIFPFVATRVGYQAK